MRASNLPTNFHFTIITDSSFFIGDSAIFMPKSSIELKLCEQFFHRMSTFIRNYSVVFFVNQVNVALENIKHIFYSYMHRGSMHHAVQLSHINKTLWSFYLRFFERSTQNSARNGKTINSQCFPAKSGYCMCVCVCENIPAELIPFRQILTLNLAHKCMNISVVMVSQPITFTFSFCFNDWQRYTDQNDYTLQCVYSLKCTGNK